MTYIWFSLSWPISGCHYLTYIWFSILWPMFYRHCDRIWQREHTDVVSLRCQLHRQRRRRLVRAGWFTRPIRAGQRRRCGDHTVGTEWEERIQHCHHCHSTTWYLLLFFLSPVLLLSLSWSFLQYLLSLVLIVTAVAITTINPKILTTSQ